MIVLCLERGFTVDNINYCIFLELENIDFISSKHKVWITLSVTCNFLVFLIRRMSYYYFVFTIEIVQALLLVVS